MKGMAWRHDRDLRQRCEQSLRGGLGPVGPGFLPRQRSSLNRLIRISVCARHADLLRFLTHGGLGCDIYIS